MRDNNEPENKKIGDHRHYTSLYQGTTHNNCILKNQMSGHTYILFHNLSGNDAHFFIKEPVNKFNKDYVEKIAENKEKYISLNVKINVKLTGRGAIKK